MHVTCKFGFGGSPRLTSRGPRNFCKPSRGGMCDVQCATNRPMTGTIVVPPFWRVEWCHAGLDPTSRSGANPENAWTHIYPDWLTDWLTNTSGQLFSPTHQWKSSSIERSMLMHLNVHSLRFLKNYVTHHTVQHQEYEKEQLTVTSHTNRRAP